MSVDTIHTTTLRVVALRSAGAAFVVALGVFTAGHAPVEALGAGLAAWLLVFTLFAPLGPALSAAGMSLAAGILGRVHLGFWGAKPIALRPEEAAALGLTLGHVDLSEAWRRLGASFTGRWWTAFSASLVASTLWSFTRYDAGAILPGTLYLVRWLAFGGVLLAAQRYVDKGGPPEGLVRPILRAGLLLSVLGLLQRALLPDMSHLRAVLPQLEKAMLDPHEGRLVSTVLDPNLLGAMLAGIAALLLARLLSGSVVDGARRTLAAWALVVLAIVLTVSRGSMLALAAGSVVVAWRLRRKLLWLAAPVVPLVAVAAPRLARRFHDALWSDSGLVVRLLGLELQPEPSAHMRIESWKTAFDVIGAHPLLGVGFNNYGLELAARQDPAAPLAGADASLLFVAATAGLLGLGLLVGLLAAVHRAARAGHASADPAARARSAGFEGMLAALLVATVFTNGLLYPPVVVMLWFVATAAAARPAAVRVASARPGLDAAA